MTTNHYKISVLVFFALFLLTGFLIFDDYGLSWDEPIQHVTGTVTLNYLRSGDEALWTYQDRYYGTIIETPLAWLAEKVGVANSRELFLFRHLMTFLIFAVGVLAFYFLCRRRFGPSWLALVGPVFLVFSPRIFADAFYNSKDIPFLVGWIVSVLTLVRLLERFSWGRIVAHALACAVLIIIRLPGLLMVAITIGILGADWLLDSSKRKLWQAALLKSTSYLLATAVFIVCLWPFLWQNPIGHFIEAFATMSRFSPQLNLSVLYLGQSILASQLPWHYIPVWIAITTPIVYLLLGLVGVGVIGREVVSKKVVGYTHWRFDLVVLGWFVGPILAVIILGSVLYDGWRHLYFIYPALILLGLIGLQWLLGQVKKLDADLALAAKVVLSLLVFGQIFLVGSFMVRNHPHQNLYFNLLAGDLAEARTNFDLDYWGLTFRLGLEYLAANDPDPIIPVAFVYGYDSTVILPPNLAARFKVLSGDISQAKYILSNYRWQDYSKLPLPAEVYSVKVDGERVMSIFRLR